MPTHTHPSGKRPILRFLKNNDVVAVVRAHQLADEGFSYHFSGGGGGDGEAPALPPVITVFSAPNYCGVHGNRAAVLNLSWSEPLTEVR